MHVRNFVGRQPIVYLNAEEIAALHRVVELTKPSNRTTEEQEEMERLMRAHRITVSHVYVEKCPTTLSVTIGDWP
jgi:hypothetical protein